MAAGMGTGVAVGVVDAPGDIDEVGVAGGRTGAVGQLASAGLNAVGIGVGTSAVAEGLGVALPEAFAVAVAFAGAGVAVTTYGV